MRTLKIAMAIVCYFYAVVCLALMVTDLVTKSVQQVTFVTLGLMMIFLSTVGTMFAFMGRHD